MSHRGGRGTRGRGGQPGANSGQASSRRPAAASQSSRSQSQGRTTPGGLVLAATDTQNTHGKRTSEVDSAAKPKRVRVSRLDRLMLESEAISQTSYRQKASAFSGPSHSINNAMAPLAPTRNPIPSDWRQGAPASIGPQPNAGGPGLSLVTPAGLPLQPSMGHAPLSTPNQRSYPGQSHPSQTSSTTMSGQFYQQTGLQVVPSIPQMLANAALGAGGLVDDEHGPESDSDSSSNGPALYPPDGNESDGAYEDDTNTFNIPVAVNNASMGNFDYNYDPILDGLNQAPLSPDSEDRLAQAALSNGSTVSLLQVRVPTPMTLHEQPQQSSEQPRPQAVRYDPAKASVNLLLHSWRVDDCSSTRIGVRLVTRRLTAGRFVSKSFLRFTDSEANILQASRYLASHPNGALAQAGPAVQNTQMTSFYPDTRNTGYQQIPQGPQLAPQMTWNTVPSGFEDGARQDIYQLHYLKNAPPRPPNPDYLNAFRPGSRPTSKPPSSSATNSDTGSKLEGSSRAGRRPRNSVRGPDRDNDKLLGYYADYPVAHKVLVLAKLFHTEYLLDRHGFPDRVEKFEETTEGMQTVVHEICSTFRRESINRLQSLIVRHLGLFPTGKNPATKQPYTAEEEQEFVRNRVKYLEEDDAARYSHKDFLTEPCADQAFGSNLLEAAVKMLLFDGNKKEKSYYERIPGFAKSKIAYPVIPFVLTIHTIDEHRTGTRKTIEFTRDAYLAVYDEFSDGLYTGLNNPLVQQHVDARLAKWHHERTQLTEQAANAKERKIKMRIRSSLTSEQAADNRFQQHPGPSNSHADGAIYHQALPPPVPTYALEGSVALQPAHASQDVAGG
uniref:DUF6532 domain-containing protein n=1 Tax=Mycena chlorophos TaxID=658473 RepID=A0ABQ0M8A6_MYCCL|nr:predicted protein [Mycena chlorophos]